MLCMVYVDDILLTGNNSNFLESTINYLQQHFKVKNLDHYFLGVEITKTDDGLL